MVIFTFTRIAYHHHFVIMVNNQEQEALDFSSRLKTKILGQKKQWLACCDSTQTIALNQAHHPQAHGTLIYTQQQTQGKGRHGRHFYSAKESHYLQSLTCSLIFQTFFCDTPKEHNQELTPMQAITLGFLTALSIREAIAKNTQLNAQIKWPNDILIDHKKVCGILTSYQTQDHSSAAVIGFGINISDVPQAPYIQQAGALYPVRTQASILYAHRLNLLAYILEQIEQHIKNYLTYGHAWLIQQYEPHMAYLQTYRPIQVADNKTYKIKILGLDDSLALRAYDPIHGEHLITTGDIGFL